MFSVGTFHGKGFPANSELGRLNGHNLEVALDWERWDGWCYSSSKHVNEWWRQWSGRAVVELSPEITWTALHGNYPTTELCTPGLQVTSRLGYPFWTTILRLQYLFLETSSHLVNKQTIFIYTIWQHSIRVGGLPMQSPFKSFEMANCHFEMACWAVSLGMV